MPLHFDDDQLLDDLSTTITQVLHAPAVILKDQLSIKETWDPVRQQMNSSLILNRLRQTKTDDPGKIIGVTDFDLFLPILTYVFGEADLDGTAAVVSSNRFRDEHYGLPPNRASLSKRLQKEAIHELGHTLGLVHCYQVSCVMRPSSYVEEIDYKSLGFCRTCQSQAQGSIDGSSASLNDS